MTLRRLGLLLPLLCALLLGAGCATRPFDAAGLRKPDNVSDPWEPYNRKMFAFNQWLDHWLIKPVARGYVAVFPKGVRTSIRHVLNNLNEPLTAANCLLQGRVKGVGISAGRLLINSTIGLVGIRDVATDARLPAQFADFGQTLWTWHVDSGPYLILPVLGPSTPRDAVGAGVDTYLDPVRYVGQNSTASDDLSLARVIASGIDKRASALGALEEMQKESVDYYATFRSLYLQNRNADLTSAQPRKAAPVPSPNFYDDPDAK